MISEICELDLPVWAVVAADHVKADRITYDAAAEIVEKLKAIDRGVCIVTTDVAERLRNSNERQNG
jgi:hypothetical protein